MKMMMTIKVRFERILDQQTKTIDVPSLFKHTALTLFQADPDLVFLPIDDMGEDQRVLKQIVHIPPGKKGTGKSF